MRSQSMTRKVTWLIAGIGLNTPRRRGLIAPCTPITCSTICRTVRKSGPVPASTKKPTAVRLVRSLDTRFRRRTRHRRRRLMSWTTCLTPRCESFRVPVTGFDHGFLNCMLTPTRIMNTAKTLVGWSLLIFLSHPVTRQAVAIAAMAVGEKTFHCASPAAPHPT